MTNESGLLPSEYNCVIKPDPVEEVTAGGIILPVATADRDKLAADEGVLVAASPLAFNYAEWPEGTRLPQVGDRVLFARYAGSLIKRGKHEWRVVKDKEIIAVVENQERTKLGIVA